MVQVLGSSITRSQTEESTSQERRCFCGRSKAAPQACHPLCYLWAASSQGAWLGVTGRRWRPARIGSHPWSCRIYSKWATGLCPWWLKYVGLGISGKGIGMNPLMLLPVTHLYLFSLPLLPWTLQILLFLRRSKKHRTSSSYAAQARWILPQEAGRWPVESPSWEGQWSLMIEAGWGCFHNMGSWRNMSPSLHVKAIYASPSAFSLPNFESNWADVAWEEHSYWGLDVSHEWRSQIKRHVTHLACCRWTVSARGAGNAVRVALRPSQGAGAVPPSTAAPLVSMGLAPEPRRHRSLDAQVPCADWPGTVCAGYPWMHNAKSWLYYPLFRRTLGKRGTTKSWCCSQRS